MSHLQTKLSFMGPKFINIRLSDIVFTNDFTTNLYFVYYLKNKHFSSEILAHNLVHHTICETNFCDRSKFTYSITNFARW
jgi:hypothetical protein